MTTHGRTGYRRVPRPFIRAWDRQLPYRHGEFLVRRTVLAFRRWTVRCGLSINRTAALLGLDRSTLLYWQQRWDQTLGRPRCIPLGRPAWTTTLAQQQDIIDFLSTFPGSTMPDLVQHYPKISHRERQRILDVYGINLHDERSLDRLPKFIWHKPGRAMDFAFPVNPIDTCFSAIFCVRDLASGYTLAADPVDTDDAVAILSSLTTLLTHDDAPLVIKLDNGPAGKSDAVQQFFASRGITPLFSPKYTPTFNGAIEAGVGIIKQHAGYLAYLKDQDDYWTSDHVEGARLWANDHRPKHRGETANQRWAQRTPITEDERTTFGIFFDAAMVRRERSAVMPCGSESASWNPTQGTAGVDAGGNGKQTLASQEELRKIDPDAIRRLAIADALKYTGNLELRSRRLSQPISRSIGRRIA